MFDAPPAGLQRTRGIARVALSYGPGGTRIAGLRQEGSAKAMLPRTDAPDPEVVFLNTAGGLTGGDLLSYRLDLAAMVAELPGAGAVWQRLLGELEVLLGRAMSVR